MTIPKPQPRSDREQLTAMTTHLRPEWDGQGVAAALYDALRLLPVAEVEQIARAAAADPYARTPQVIAYRARSQAEARGMQVRAEEAAATRRTRACVAPVCDGKCATHRAPGPPPEWQAARAALASR